LHAGGGVDRLPLADRFDPTGAEQAEREETDRFEIPSEGYLGELVL
jgi:hypothetical protein